MSTESKPYKILPTVRKVASPIGVARHAYLNKPDHGQAGWYDEVGNFKADLVVPKEEAQEFIDKFKELLDAQVAEILPHLKGASKAKFKVRDLFEEGCPIGHDYDDDGETTGNVVIKFKSSASFTNKKTGEVVSLKPRIVDCTPKSEGGPFVVTKIVYGGSTIRLSCNMKPYYHTNAVGVKLEINAVQVIKMAEYGNDNDDEGFDDFEGGFTASAPSKSMDHPTEAPSSEEEDF